MINIQVQVTGIDEWIAKLKSISDGIADLTPEYEAVGNHLVPFFENDVFETEGGAIDQDWAPLSATYDAWKTVHYPGRGTLERTGTLRYGFSAISTAQYLLIQNKAPYAGYIQYGTSRMPARIFMAITDNMNSTIRQMIIDSLSARL